MDPFAMTTDNVMKLGTLHDPSPQTLEGLKQKDAVIIVMDSCCELGNAVAKYLFPSIKKVDTSFTRFKNNEINNFPSESVRSKDVYVIGTGSNYNGSVNDNFMAMCGMIRACRNGSAKYITAICAYLPYSRSDKKDQARTPIMAKLICDFFKEAGANRLICADLHAAQIQGMFDGPCDNLYGTKYLLPKITQDYPDTEFIVISPDVGGIKRIQDWANQLNTNDYSFLTKSRDHNKVSQIIKHDLADTINFTNKLALLVDDLGDTMGTLNSAAKILKEKGAEKVVAVVTHGIFSGDAFKFLAEDNIDRIYVTNTLPQKDNLTKSDKIVVVDLSELFGLAILACINATSMASLF
jgi:ribose-phosphate pyrophosphokinase